MKHLSLLKCVFILFVIGTIPQAFGRNVWDGPETIFYERLDMPDTWSDTYFQFVPDYLNPTVLEVYSDGTPKKYEEGYVYQGKKDGYDCYVGYYNERNPYTGRIRSILKQYIYLLVNQDKSKIIKYSIFGDVVCKDVYTKGDPNNRKPRPKPKYDNTPVYPAQSTPSQPTRNDENARTITCSSCGGTGLEPKGDWCTICYGEFDKLIYCRQCGREHCPHIRHENCIICDGYGKVAPKRW